MSIFSDRLKWMREKRGLTQKDMAEKLGMSGSSYSKYEYGLREPNLETLTKLPYIFDISVDFLLGIMDYDNEIESDIAILNSTTQNIAVTKKRLRETMMKSEEFELVYKEDSELIEKSRERSSFIIENLQSDLEKYRSDFDKLRDNIKLRLKEIPHVSERTLSFLDSLER